MILTRTTGNFAVNAMPLLTEVVLNAFESVKGWHFLRAFVCARLAPSIVGWVLVLHLRWRLLLWNGAGFVSTQSCLALWTPVRHSTALLSGWLQTSILLSSLIALRLIGWALICRAVSIWLCVHPLLFYFINLAIRLWCPLLNWQWLF